MLEIDKNFKIDQVTLREDFFLLRNLCDFDPYSQLGKLGNSKNLYRFLEKKYSLLIELLLEYC